MWKTPQNRWYGCGWEDVCLPTHPSRPFAILFYIFIYIVVFVSSNTHTHLSTWLHPFTQSGYVGGWLGWSETHAFNRLPDSQLCGSSFRWIFLDSPELRWWEHRIEHLPILLFIVNGRYGIRIHYLHVRTRWHWIQRPSVYCELSCFVVKLIQSLLAPNDVFCALYNEKNGVHFVNPKVENAFSSVESLLEFSLHIRENSFTIMEKLRKCYSK